MVLEMKMEHLKEVLNTIAAILGLIAFIGVILFVSKCDGDKRKTREKIMIECVRQSCDWITEQCFCSIRKKK